MDSVSKNFAVKDDVGTVKHGVQSLTPDGTQFVTGVNDAGTLSRSPVTFAQFQGQASTGQYGTNTVTLDKLVPTALQHAYSGAGIRLLARGRKSRWGLI